MDNKNVVKCSIPIIGADQWIPQTSWQFTCKRDEHVPTPIDRYECSFSGSTSKVKPKLWNRSFTRIDGDPCSDLNEIFSFDGKQMLIEDWIKKTMGLHVRMKDDVGAAIGSVHYKEPCDENIESCANARNQLIEDVARKFGAKAIMLRNTSTIKEGKSMKLDFFFHDDSTKAPAERASLLDSKTSRNVDYGGFMRMLAEGFVEGIVRAFFGGYK